MKEITINDLWKACVEERKKGNGKKKILVPSDEEGNSYNAMYHLFSPTDEYDPEWSNFPRDVTEENKKDYIILG